MVFDKKTIVVSALVLAGVIALPAPAAAQARRSGPATAEALLYCCRDAKNNRSCGDSLPMQCVGRPYVVTGPGGRVVRQVEAPLTPEQQKARAALEERKKAEEEAKAEQARKDKALLVTYSEVGEIDEAKARAEKEIMDSIAQAEKKVAELEKKKAAAIGDPELYKKQGVPADVKSKLASVDLEIKLQNELIASKRTDLEAARLRFEDDKKRFLQIQERRAAFR